MIRGARALYLTTLGLWVGGMATLAFIVAPTVFRKAPSRAVAGTIFGAVLQSFGTLQLVLAFLALAAVVVLRFSGDIRPKQALARVGVLLLMVLLVAGSHLYIAPAIQRERDAIPNFDAIPAGVPARARFDSLHAWSVRLAGTTLILGAGLLLISAAGPKTSSNGP